MKPAQKRRDQRRRFHQRRARRAARNRKRTKERKSRPDQTRPTKYYLPHKHKPIVCPPSLHIDRDPISTAAALQFLCELHNVIVQGKYDRVTIDHRELQDISPAAVLVLLAYTHHAMQQQPQIRLKALLPTAPDVLSLLQSAGYFEYYQLHSPIPPDKQAGVLGHIREQGVKTKRVEEFMRRLPPSLVQTSSLYEALIEAAKNTVEWAYSREELHPYWWLMAAHPPKSGEISICFVDLGVGIPKTIRVRLKDRVPLLNPQGCELIRKAVMQGKYSNTQKPNRGNGLPTLKRLIDSGPHGQMTVLSLGSFFQYKRGSYCDDGSPTTLAKEIHKGSNLRGTVISWKIAKQ